MDRRNFISNIALGSFAFSGSSTIRAMGQDSDNKDYGVASLSPTVVDKIGNFTLQELRDYHQKELDEQYIALWDKYGIDWEFGGVIPYWDENGNFTSDIKEMYYLGRALWIFSYLYNHFGKNERHLKAAKMTKDFTFKYCRDENGYWISEVTREGKFVKGSFNIYGDMYMVLGLTEYYIATGDEEARDIAIESAHGVNERIVSLDYQHLGGHGSGHEPGTKRLGTWQHFLSTLTPLARETNDYGITMIARMCVRNIMERHYRPEYGVAFEYLDDMFQPFERNTHRTVSGWHSIQAAWMCMDEALRMGDKRIFMDAMEMGRLTLEKCWAEGEKGGLVSISNPEARPVESNDYAPSGATDDAIIFTLLAIEHTHAPWAVYWFDKVFAHGQKHYDLWKRSCLLHHPRRLFLDIEMLDRMIARNGRVSNFLEG
ncbi:AGE family epimerase/isomerase [Candidatus Latescibacterota bacterium]